MKKDKIFQFVCFITNLPVEEFMPKWEHYAKRLITRKAEPALQQQVPGTKSRFRYISQHEWPDQDFQFSFMDERRSEHFPEHNVKVVQTGGYVPLYADNRHKETDSEIKLIVFVSHNETDIDFYRRLPLFHRLNIYEAFYESCSHAYVMEFFIPEKDADEMMLMLKQRSSTEVGQFRECLVPHM
jgi:hypothetical protein